jgi:hypothetical protein
MERQVFISHSSADRKLASKLCKMLWRRGLEVWWDEPASKDRADWRRWTEDAIRLAKLVLVLVRPGSPDEAQRFTWQETLLSAWRDPFKKILPLLLEDASIPPFVYSSSRPFLVVRLPDPTDPRQVEAAADAVMGVAKPREQAPASVAPSRAPIMRGSTPERLPAKRTNTKKKVKRSTAKKTTAKKATAARVVKAKTPAKKSRQASVGPKRADRLAKQGNPRPPTQPLIKAVAPPPPPSRAGRLRELERYVESLKARS